MIRSPRPMMWTRTLWTVLWVGAALATGGCGEQGGKAGPAPDADPHAGHAHEGHADEEGPHGGMLTILGDHAAHVEVVHHMDEGRLELYVLDADLKPAQPEEAPVLNLVVGGAALQLEGQAGLGETGLWTFTHEALKSEPEKARVRLRLAGKSYSPELEHEHEAEHEHDGDHGHEDEHD